MAKLTLTDISSGYQSADAVNDNGALIEAAFENTLSRDGTTPNSMNADLDMNDNDVLNVGTISAGSITLNGTALTSTTVDVLTTTQTAQIGYSARSADNATAAAALADGTIIRMAGLEYEVDSSATGAASATNDLSVDGLKPFGVAYINHFGADPDNDAATNTTALQGWANWIDQSAYRVGSALPGAYQINGGCGFTNSNVALFGYGVNLIQNSTSAVAFDLNEDSAPGETDITSYFYVKGWSFSHATTNSGSHTCVAIRSRGQTRVFIEDIRVWDQGTAFVLAPRDALVMRNCNGFRCGVYVSVPDYTTTSANNPQNMWFENNAFSLRYDATYKFDAAVNMVHIKNGYTVGSRAIVAQAAPVVSGNNTSFHIEGMDFEQGSVVTLTGTWTFTSGSTTVTAPGANGAATTELFAGARVLTAGDVVYTVASITSDDEFELTANASGTESNVAAYEVQPYIDIRDDNTGDLFNVTIEKCQFSGFEGTTTDAYCLHLRNVRGAKISENEITSSAASPGWIYLDVDCEDIHIGPNQFTTLSWANWPAISYDCARSEIFIEPSIMFPNDDGLLTGYVGSAHSDETTTLDMSSLLSSNFPGIAPPTGYWITGQVRDSASSTTGASFAIVPDSGIATNDYWQHAEVDLQGVVDNVWVPFHSYVDADSAGDLYLVIDASGTDTFDTRFKVVGINMSGGK